MTLRYEITLYWSEEDQAFIAEVPELPECAADSETYQEALQNIEIVMQEWIETANELGHTIPPSETAVDVRVTDECIPKRSSDSTTGDRSFVNYYFLQGKISKLSQCLGRNNLKSR